MASVREWVGDWQGVFGRRARSPLFAGKLIATSAAVFTSLWLLVPVLGNGDTQYSIWRLLPGPVWVALVVCNAFGVTALLWHRFVAPAPRFGPTRAVGVGLGIGVVSYPTLCLLLIPVSVLQTETLPWPTVGETLWFVLGGTIGGLYATAAIPVALSVAVALALSRYDRRDAEHESPANNTY